MKLWITHKLVTIVLGSSVLVVLVFGGWKLCFGDSPSP